jgi:hypothetical protein
MARFCPSGAGAWTLAGLIRRCCLGDIKDVRCRLPFSSGHELPPSQLKDNLAGKTLGAPVSAYFTF